ncbi:MAG: ABC transporter substrate-binding protein [Candidatus Aminicenantia bacterium]
MIISIIYMVNCGEKILDKTLIESIRSFPTTLNPVYVTDEVGTGIVDKIFSGLFCFDEKGNPIPDLVKSYSFSEQGKEILITLRTNVYWHDGHPFSAKDVIFTFRLLRNPEIAYPYLPDLEPIKEIKKLNSNQMKIIYHHPFAPALIYLTFKILPAHLLKNYLENGQKFKESSFSFSPIGTGPYRFIKLIPDQKIILESFSEYFLGESSIKKYIAQLNVDALTNPLKLIKGEVDLAEIEPELVASLTNNKKFNQKIKIFPYQKNSFTYLAFNLDLPFFKSRAIRQALALGLNRESIRKNILRDWGEICSSPIILSKWKNQKIKHYPYQPNLAKKLLKEEGWQDSDQDGILEKDGRKFSFTILTNSESLLRRHIALASKQDWENLGLKVEVEFTEYGIFLQRLKKKNFETAISGFLLDLDPNQLDLWHSEGFLNYSGYHNKQVDQLLAEGQNVLDLNKRREIYNKFQEIIAFDLPVIFLFSPHYLMGANRRIKLSRYPKIIGSVNSFSSFIRHWEIEN